MRTLRRSLLALAPLLLAVPAAHAEDQPKAKKRILLITESRQHVLHRAGRGLPVTLPDTIGPL